MKKALVVGIILLFIGVGFQPAIANEISDVDEDCFECQPMNRVTLLKVRLLLIQFEVFTNILMNRFGHIPEVKEKCQVISENISIFKEFKEKLYSFSQFQDIPLICYILYPIFIILMELVESFPQSDIPILKQILNFLSLIIDAQFLIVLGLAVLFDCFQYPEF